MIEAIFEELKRQGVVRSGSDFSEQWLGMEASYFRAVRRQHRTASPKALATCAARLKRHAHSLQSSSLPQVREWANGYNQLADKCVAELLSVCEG